MYKLPRIAKYDAKIRISQYKLLNNVLYLNRKIFHFGIITQPKCSICNLYDETPQCFRSELYYSKSFASNFQIQCV